jgi:PPE-repeat protein
MNFAMLAPEINSGRMYGGAGSGSMIKAVASWDRLAACLHDATAKTPRTEATAPYIDWLNASAAQAAQAAARVAAAASAHQSALAAMVAPQIIDANRAELRSLASANRLGQAGPAMAAAEAEYERIWAQDVAAMYAYAAASAKASTMAPFTSPPTSAVPGAPRTWALRSAPEVVSTGRDVISAIPRALQAFSRSPVASLDASLGPVTPSLSRLSSLSAPSGLAISRLNSLNKAAALRWLLPNQGDARGAPIAARFGSGTSIGALSVPAAWAAAVAPTPVYRGTVA